MRFLAASLFLSAAFDWPVPWVDRGGVAALGLFCLSLTVGAALPGRRSARPSQNGLPFVQDADVPGPTEDALEAWAKRY
jgi:hypothetical protein